MGALTTGTIIFEGGTGDLTFGERYLTIFSAFLGDFHYLANFLLIGANRADDGCAHVV